LGRQRPDADIKETGDGIKALSRSPKWRGTKVARLHYIQQTILDNLRGFSPFHIYFFEQ
jgi:hypothetical protein